MRKLVNIRIEETLWDWAHVQVAVEKITLQDYVERLLARDKAKIEKQSNSLRKVKK